MWFSSFQASSERNSEALRLIYPHPYLRQIAHTFHSLYMECRKGNDNKMLKLKLIYICTLKSDTECATPS